LPEVGEENAIPTADDTAKKERKVNTMILERDSGEAKQGGLLFQRS